MTTAHRPTFYNALGGEQQGGNLIVAPTTKVCSRDLPGHKVLKIRQAQPAPLYSEIETKTINSHGVISQKEILKEQLDNREKQHRIKKELQLSRKNQPLEASRFLSDDILKEKPPLLAIEQNLFPEDEDDFGPIENIENRKTSNQEVSLDAESDDEEEQQLLRELEKIKREREEEKLKVERELREQQEQEEKERSLTSNVLLMLDSTQPGELKRRWDDDCIFRNQAKDLAKPKKRFINDTLRSDFHRKFLAKYIT